jgi:hypothetical protein
MLDPLVLSITGWPGTAWPEPLATVTRMPFSKPAMLPQLVSEFEPFVAEQVVDNCRLLSAMAVAVCETVFVPSFIEMVTAASGSAFAP